VRITLRAHKERVSTRTSGSITTALTGALPAQSRRWLRLVEELETSLAASDRIVLVGEPGTGKRHIARALLPSTAIETDCTRGDETLALLRERTSNAQPLIVTHIERLSDAALAEIREILAVESHPEAPVVFTFTRERRELESLTPRGNGIAPCIQVPALRDRLDDLPNLVAVLSAESAVEGKPPMRWMPDALQVLARVDWPQNLRSLQSVVDAVSRDCRTGYVDSRLLPEGVRAQGTGRRLSRLEQLEASEILASLREYDGNKLATARRLGIARSTLYRRMRALGIDLVAVNY
jgi:transcriptional regulator of acetoin/glycerol metabolism